MPEQSFNVTLKLNHDDGNITSARLLKSRSKLPEDVLTKLNEVMSKAFDQHAEQTQPVAQSPAQDVELPDGSTLTLTQELNQTLPSASLGILAEQAILGYLRSIERVNQDFSVDDTSSLLKHGDISVETQGARICIEVKNYTKPVPSKEIDKFYDSVALPDYAAGVIIQMHDCGFARERSIKTPIDIRIVNGKPLAFVTAASNELFYPLIMTMLSIAKAPSVENIQDALDKARRKLNDVYEYAREMKTCIEAQKKSIARMERLLNETLALSLD